MTVHLINPNACLFLICVSFLIVDEHRKYMDESQKEKKRCFNYLSDYTEKNANLFSRDAQWLMRKYTTQGNHRALERFASA